MLISFPCMTFIYPYNCGLVIYLICAIFFGGGGVPRKFFDYTIKLQNCSRSATVHMFIIIFFCHSWWPALYLGVCLKQSPPLAISGSKYSSSDCPFLILRFFTSLLAFLCIGSQRHFACTSVRGPTTEVAVMTHPTNTREVIGPKDSGLSGSDYL